MLDRFDCEIYIEITPIEMVRIQKFNILNCRNRCVLKPRKVFEREKVFFLVKQQPESVLRNLTTSTSEVLEPSVSDFILVFLDQASGG
jgi:hypothetical protein